MRYLPEERTEIAHAGILEDIAILTGGKLIAEEIGLTLEKVTIEDLGQAKQRCQ